MRSLPILGLVVASALLGLGCQNERANVEGSRAAAERWVADVMPEGYSVVGFSCATLDTDEDGYVTADVMLQTPDGDHLLIQLDTPTQGLVMDIQKGDSAKLHQIPYNNRFPGRADVVEKP